MVSADLDPDHRHASDPLLMVSEHHDSAKADAELRAWEVALRNAKEDTTFDFRMESNIGRKDIDCVQAFVLGAFGANNGAGRSTWVPRGFKGGLEIRLPKLGAGDLRCVQLCALLPGE